MSRSCAGAHVRLEPLSMDHVPDLAAAEEDRSSFGLTFVPRGPETADYREDLCAVEVGWTWLAASAQRTGINREAKLLLFTYAFESLGVARVDLKTDARNERSRRAIAGRGATFEGVLRSGSRSHAEGETGRLRDSAMFSVVAAEWPAVRTHLEGQIRTPT